MSSQVDVSKLSAGDAKIYKVFSILDQDNSGSLEPNELISAIELIKGKKMKKDEKEKMMKVIDRNSDGSVSFEEFLLILKDSDEDLHRAFEAYDLNHDGFISKDELIQVMASVGEPITDEEATKMIESADVDGDGQVNFIEFTKMVDYQG